MKKFYLFLPLIAIPMLSGCESTPTITQLTFGTYKDTGAIQLSSSEFTTHVENRENLLLAIYPESTTPCRCWTAFSEVLDAAVSDDHLLIYKFYAQDVENNIAMKEIGGFNNRLDAPTFYIIKDKQIAKYYNYSDKNEFFKKKSIFLEELNNHVKLPKMYYVDEDGLDEAIKGDKAVVFFARNKCNDCNYVIPNTLVPYFDSLTVEKGNMYISDIQEYRDEDPIIYQEIKDKYNLSTVNNPNLGFSTGVVPTFQIYEKGALKDMCVYVNDGELTYSEADGCYYATNTYYQGERLNYFHYLDDIELKDLSKIQISEADTDTYENSHYWKITSSSLYHDVILKGFLNTYL